MLAYPRTAASARPRSARSRPRPSAPAPASRWPYAPGRRRRARSCLMFSFSRLSELSWMSFTNTCAPHMCSTHVCCVCTNEHRRHAPRVRLGVEDEDDVGGDDPRQLVALPLVGDARPVLPPLPVVVRWCDDGGGGDEEGAAIGWHAVLVVGMVVRRGRLLVGWRDPYVQYTYTGTAFRGDR